MMVDDVPEAERHLDCWIMGDPCGDECTESAAYDAAPQTEPEVPDDNAVPLPGF